MRVSVAVSLGGAKLRVGLVSETGRVIETTPETLWRPEFCVSDAREEDAEPLVAGIVSFIDRAIQQVPIGRVARIGLATKGPLEYRNGDVILGPGKKQTTLPFKDYPIKRRLHTLILQRYVGRPERRRLRKIPIDVLHDGAAAALGEVRPGGTFPGAKDAAAIIIGSGVGLGAIRNGKLYTGNPRLKKERVFGSLGRHLVYVPDRSGRNYKYQYRDITKGSMADINENEREAYFSKRVAGPWLSQRIATNMLSYKKRAAPANYANTLVQMGFRKLGNTTLERFSRRANTNKFKKLEKGILAGLTSAALKGDRWARNQIADVGTEVGRALAQFILEFKNKRFVRRIALVSTVAENLGLGVRGTSDDLFIEKLHEEVEHALLGTDLSCEILRSSNLDRELRAFTPT